LAALRDVLKGVATNSRTLMVGLSLQDTNLQDLFAAARATLPWSWPCAPGAQGHVFCEDALGDHQVNMLRVVYGAAYGVHGRDIESSALLRAYAKQALLALVLCVVSDKLRMLAEMACGAFARELSDGMKCLRDSVAAAAVGDHLAFVDELVRLWSRGIALFRRGDQPPADCDGYEAISPLPIQEMTADPNVLNSGLPELAVGLALLGRGEAAGKWSLSLPPAAEITCGALQATGTWDGARATQVYFVNGTAAALELMKRGAFAKRNVVVIHSDDAWNRMRDVGSPYHRSPMAPRGRERQPAVRHASIRQLLQSAADFAALEQRFEEVVTL
jgi:hypothetical protein